MKLLRLPFRALALAAVSVGSVASAAVSSQITPEQRDFFENKIRPIFAEHCLECHSAAKSKTKGGFNMDTRESLLKGGDNGSALKPGDSKASLLMKAVRWEGDLQMPEKKKLSDEQIALLAQWVEMGAPDPREAGAPVKDKKDHWSYQPVSRPEVPVPKNVEWCKTSIDKFILAKLDSMGLVPAAPPDTGTLEEKVRKREALLRRAYFDLIGMPPSPKELREFAYNEDPNAFATVVDKLLASQAYGERWARHWLDTARYSDTKGTVGNVRGEDYRYAYAWAYRDWVIKAINQDMPYDQFVMNQIAADKIPNNPKENLAALGFLTVGQRFQDQDDMINDRIDAVGRGFLGLTLACARCHNHKFDAVTQADYYALRGVFASTVEPKESKLPVIAGDENSKEYQDFVTKLEGLEKRAYATVYLMQREVSQKFRAKAAAYFKAAWELTKKDDKEAKERVDALIEKEKLDGRFITDHLTRHSRLDDPVMGPFLKLFALKENREELLKLMLSKNGTKGKTKHNPVVIEFLNGAGTLPSDMDTVAVLFEKFCREKIEPLMGGPITPRMDPVKAMETGGIFKDISDPNVDIPSSKDRPLMELASFPLAIVPGSEMVALERVQQVVRQWGLTLGGQLDGRAGLAEINALKLTSTGGPVRAMVLEDLPKPVDSPIYPRGNKPKPEDKAKVVPRRFIEVLSQGGSAQPFKEGSGRYELAKAIASKSNPLTARVMVNRIWMYHFGEGMVRTPDDLGVQAGMPSHPELLDWLSTWFMEDMGPAKPGWSVKALHKAIMLSSVYQQDSRTPHLARQKEKDAANAYLWRANVRRLDFEAFRDSLLTMSGYLNRNMYGPPENLVTEPYSLRRSVYGYIDRTNVPDLLNQFDMASALEPNTKRTSTIVPQQALFLMNSPFSVGVVQSIVNRPEVRQAYHPKDPNGAIDAIFHLVLQRTPTPREREMAKAYLMAEAKSQAGVVAATAKMAEEANKKAEARAKQEAQAMKTNARGAIVNQGFNVEVRPMSPYEALVQALIYSNEAAYIN